MMKRLILFMILFSTPLTLDAEIVRRAALDIGSGETKITIADVDSESRKIVSICYQDYKPVELRKDLAFSKEGVLSKKIEEELIATLQEYQKSSLCFGPIEWSGIGTAVFRQAKNGQDLLIRVSEVTKIPLSIATQEEEGEIGFQTAVAASRLLPDQVIAWDSGSGSFQITTCEKGNLNLYGAEFAALQAALLFIKEVRDEELQSGYQFNPISLQEINRFISLIQNKLPPPPQWLTDTNKNVIAFGGDSSIFSIGSIATGKCLFTKEDLFEAMKGILGKSNHELSLFPEPRMAIIGLALLYSVMDHCNIPKISYVMTNGSCEGLLIMERYWPSKIVPVCENQIFSLT